MQITLQSIPLREALHFLGWRGTPLEPELVAQLKEACDRAIGQIQPRVTIRKFSIEQDGGFASCAFIPKGKDVRAMLEPCREGVLLAATLGAQSERLLLREQARGSAEAVMMDAVLSAAIEAVCDEQESVLRSALQKEGLYLTDRFSPGYGDMPIAQTREICAVLDTPRTIGLTVSSSGIMIPRKSVTAMMGIASVPVTRRASPCALCSAREYCKMRRNEE